MDFGIDKGIRYEFDVLYCGQSHTSIGSTSYKLDNFPILYIVESKKGPNNGYKTIWFL